MLVWHSIMNQSNPTLRVDYLLGPGRLDPLRDHDLLQVHHEQLPRHGGIPGSGGSHRGGGSVATLRRVPRPHSAGDRDPVGVLFLFRASGLQGRGGHAIARPTIEGGPLYVPEQCATLSRHRSEGGRATVRQQHAHERHGRQLPQSAAERPEQCALQRELRQGHCTGKLRGRAASQSQR